MTGVPNELILDNIRHLCCRHPNITIRVPLIPGVNDDENNLQETAALVRSFGGGVRRLELLPYNSMAGSKYTALGKEAALIAGQSQDHAMMQRICKMMAVATPDRSKWSAIDAVKRYSNGGTPRACERLHHL